MNPSRGYTLARGIFVSSQPAGSPPQKLAVKSYDLRVSIRKFSETIDVRTFINIVFENPNGVSVEGVFTFPLPDDINLLTNLPRHAMISRDTVCVDDNYIEAPFLRHKRLAKLYKALLHTQDFEVLQRIGTAALQAEIPPIPAGEDCAIGITYSEHIDATDESLAYTHHLPTNQPIGTFTASIEIFGTAGVETFECPSHDVTIAREDDARAHMRYAATDVNLGTDFVCRYAFGDEIITHSDPIQCEAIVTDLSMPYSDPGTSLSAEGIVYTMTRKAKQPHPHALSTSMSLVGLRPPNGAAYHDVFFKGHGTNPFIDPEDDNMSTFGMDADSAAYAVMRRYIRDGSLPPTEAIRVEEFVNAFDYDYTPPTDAAFAVHLEGAPSKFGEGKRLQLLRVGLQGRVVPDVDRKDAMLTFVIDVSGSMGMENRLELVKKALRLLVEQLRPADKIGIVVYGTNARVVLPHTSVANKEHILEEIDSLWTEGATNVEDGIHKGYELARQNSENDCINRVILCSDGVANQGETSPKILLKQIRDYVEDDGIFLTTVGFGMGNYNDTLMEKLAKKGNGNYAYVDTLNEARRIFVENLTGTLQVIAKDAKVQVEFNPDNVRSFRLIGYENRQMKHEDFRNDDADAGEIGSGHSVTALYEVKLNKGVDSGELAKVSIRYEDPDTTEVTEVSEKFRVDDLKDTFGDASPGLQFAASVAQFAEILRESVWAKNGCLKTVRQTLRNVLRQHPEVVAKGEEQAEARGEELLALVRNARRIKATEQVEEN